MEGEGQLYSPETGPEKLPTDYRGDAGPGFSAVELGPHQSLGQPESSEDVSVLRSEVVEEFVNGYSQAEGGWSTDGIVDDLETRVENGELTFLEASSVLGTLFPDRYHTVYE